LISLLVYLKRTEGIGKWARSGAGRKYFLARRPATGNIASRLEMAAPISAKVFPPRNFYKLSSKLLKN